MTIIWYMILEIWSATDRVYCNFGTFFCPFTPLTTNKIKILKKNEKPWKYYDLYKSTKNAIHMMYGSWDKKHNRENFLPFLGQFLPFYLTNNLKNQSFKKNEKNPWRYHHFIQEHQKSWSYVILLLRYSVWWM